jgi:hypothetical protein
MAYPERLKQAVCLAEVESAASLDLLVIKQEHLDVLVVWSQKPATCRTGAPSLGSERFFYRSQGIEVEGGDKIRIRGRRQGDYRALACLVPPEPWKFFCQGNVNIGAGQTRRNLSVSCR